MEFVQNGPFVWPIIDSYYLFYYPYFNLIQMLKLRCFFCELYVYNNANFNHWNSYRMLYPFTSICLFNNWSVLCRLLSLSYLHANAKITISLLWTKVYIYNNANFNYWNSYRMLYPSISICLPNNWLVLFVLLSLS